MTPAIDDVREAARRIAGHVHRTPVVTSATLDARLGARCFFKCENLQKVGAFKARGATNAVLALDSAAAARGVITHSSGNHAAALAYAAGRRGIPCTVVMPETAPAVKLAAVRGYGAEIVLCKPPERQQVCLRLVSERGMTLVHPFENPYVIAGQGTAALELLDEVDGLDAIVTPVGGGGLLTGTAIVLGALRPSARALGAEPAAVDDACRSLRSGALQPAVSDPRTLADGLLTGLGRINFEILRAHEVEVLTVGEDAIAEACRFVLERMKLLIEPSAATVVAALLANVERFRERRVGAIFSGGNTDLRWLG